MVRILRDVDLDKSRLEMIGKLTVYTFLTILLLKLLVAFFSKNRGKCSFAIWQNVLYIQLIRWLGLIKIDSDSEFSSFFKEFTKILHPIRLSTICEDEELTTSSYHTMQIKSSGFLNNAKELLVIYVLILTICFFTYIVNKLTHGIYFSEFIKVVKYSVLIRLHLLLFLDFLTLSMINIKHFNESSPCSTVNITLSVFFMALALYLIVRIPLVIKKKLIGNLDTHHGVIFESISTIVEEFKPEFKISVYQYYTIFLLYRFSLAFSLVFLPSSPIVQLFVLLSFQTMLSNKYIVFYIGLARPFRYKSDMYSVLASEALCFVLVIFVCLRIIDMGANSKYFITLFCVFLIWLIEIVIVLRFISSFKRKSFLESSEELNATSPQIAPDHLTQNNVVTMKMQSNDNSFTSGRLRLPIFEVNDNENRSNFNGKLSERNNDVILDSDKRDFSHIDGSISGRNNTVISETRIGSNRNHFGGISGRNNTVISGSGIGFSRGNNGDISGRKNTVISESGFSFEKRSNLNAYTVKSTLPRENFEISSRLSVIKKEESGKVKLEKSTMEFNFDKVKEEDEDE